MLAAEGLHELEWTGRADGLRVCRVDVMPPRLGAGLPGPVALGVAWVRAGLRDNPLALNTLARQTVLNRDSRAGCRSLLTLTNEGVVRAHIEHDVAVHISLTDELDTLLDRHPAVRRRVPSLLGVCDLALDPELTTRCDWDGDAAVDLTRVFVPTRAYSAALDALERHRFAVISGPPEMGKTAIARVLALALLTEGWEVHECIRPEQVFAAFARDRRQLFIADDAFGSTEYRPDAAERWALELDRILRSLDDAHWLVWTSRPAPLKAGLARLHREHGVERFPRPAEVHVDATALDIEERATILYRHTRSAGLPREASVLVRRHGPAIVDHAHFTPERMRRFVANRLPELAGKDHTVGLRSAIVDEIAEPTEAMAASFDALAPEHRALLLALVDAPAGPVPERELAASARRHSPGGLPRAPAQLVDRLTDHFVRVVPPVSVTWVHPSWRDLVIDRLSSDPQARSHFLGCCSIEGVLLALSRGGGRAGNRSRPLLRTHGDWDALRERLFDLVPELADPDLLRLFSTFEDALEPAGLDPDAGELAALAGATLSRISGCWDRRRSFATFDLLQRWQEVWELLGGEPTPPVRPVLWAPKPTERNAADDDDIADPVPETGWGASEQLLRERIVDRILADLEA